MNYLSLGKQYIIRSRKMNGGTKQPYNNEWRVAIEEFCDRNPDRVFVRFLSGDVKIMGKTRAISYKSYFFEDVDNENDSIQNKNKQNENIEDNHQEIKNGYLEFRETEHEIKKNMEEFNALSKEVHLKLNYYKQLEKEVVFLRIIMLIIIYMYVYGYIRFV